MGAILSDRRAQAQVNSGDLPLIGVTPRRQQPINSDEGGLWILPLIARAIERSVGHKAAAITAQMDKGQFSRQLAGDGHLSVRRLAMMGDAFWLELIDVLREHFKLDNDADRLDRALDAITSGLKVVGEIARKGIR